MRRVAVGNATPLLAAALTALLASYAQDAVAGPPNPHECLMSATGTSPPPPGGGTVTYEATSMECSIGEPAGTLFGGICTGATASASLTGTFDVVFTPLAGDIVELKVTNMALSHPTFDLCGHTLELKGHLMPEANQALEWNSGTGTVSGTSLSIYTARIDDLFDAKANEFGMFNGNLAGLDLDFMYSGVWTLISPIPGLSDWGFVALAVLLLAAAGVALIRRSRRAARSA